MEELQTFTTSLTKEKGEDFSPPTCAYARELSPQTVLWTSRTPRKPSLLHERF
jgi:hypothetical protein